jgi:hypothetical protein
MLCLADGYERTYIVGVFLKQCLPAILLQTAQVICDLREAVLCCSLSACRPIASTTAIPSHTSRVTSGLVGHLEELGML